MNRASVALVMDLDAAKTRLQEAMQVWKDRNKRASWGKLADKIDLGAETVRLYSKGKQFPPFPALVSLCKELGVAPIFVLFGREEEVPGLIRVGVSSIEMDLLKLFRQLSQPQQLDLVQYVKYRVEQSPLPNNVKHLRQ